MIIKVIGSIIAFIVRWTWFPFLIWTVTIPGHDCELFAWLFIGSFIIQLPPVQNRLQYKLMETSFGIKPTLELDTRKPEQVPYQVNIPRPQEKNTAIASSTALLASKSVDEVWQDIDSMIGLESVKQSLREIEQNILANEIRRQAGMNIDPGTLHMVFKGNPGSGKTEIARKVGELFAAMGVLPGSYFIEPKRPELVGQYIGQTAHLVNEQTDKVLNNGGGVIFIDEAYGLHSHSATSIHGYNFGHEAVEELIKIMENQRDKICVIFAGYPDLMVQFIKDANPGLKSRIPFHIDFPDYSPEELYQIFESQAGKKGYIISEQTKEKVLMHFTNTKIDGNGRYVRNMLEKAERKQAGRILEEGSDPRQLTPDDFEF